MREPRNWASGEVFNAHLGRKEDNMRISHLMLLVGTVLAMPAAAVAQSSPGLQQTLGGLLTGNQGQDDALRQAYQRGYERGRNDEARALQANSRGNRSDDRYSNGPRPNYGDPDYSGR
jgi:hypothetical protein